MIAFLLAAALTAATEPAAPQGTDSAEAALASLSEAPAFDENASAREILDACRKMMPKDIVISGHVNRRSRHGTQIAAYRYVIARHAGETDLKLTNDKGEAVPFEKNGRLVDTDLTWSDLAMDFLWWEDVAFDEAAESETLTGIVCKVLRVTQGKRAFRIWVDRRTGVMVQANELREVDGEWKTLREVFCTSIRRFDGRWAPRNIEVGPKGAKYRTKIVVEDVK